MLDWEFEIITSSIKIVKIEIYPVSYSIWQIPDMLLYHNKDLPCGKFICNCNY